MPIRVGRGAAMIVLDDDLSRAIEAAIAQVAPTVVPRMRAAAEEIAANARTNAPVKTGRFRDGFTTGVRLPDLNTVEAFVQNDTPYWRYIKDPLGRSVWADLVARPVRRTSQRLADELAPELARLVDGG